MYTNVAYLGKPHEDVVDNSVPLLITAAGHYYVHSVYRVPTNRRLGRKDYQLLYIADGQIQIFFDGKEHILGKGNMLLFRPDEPQIYYLFAKYSPKTYWVHFTGNAVEKMLDKYQMPKGRNIFYIGTSPDYQWMFNQMIQELQLRRTNYEELLCINLHQIFLIINRYIQEADNISNNILDEIERAKHYFIKNYNKRIVIEQYAQERLMSSCWFINNFKRIIKCTPMQFILNLRIEKAKELLEFGNYNISQVSAMVGYDNPLYFSRLFKKYVGVSPKEYKKGFN